MGPNMTNQAPCAAQKGSENTTMETSIEQLDKTADSVRPLLDRATDLIQKLQNGVLDVREIRGRLGLPNLDNCAAE